MTSSSIPSFVRIGAAILATAGGLKALQSEAYAQSGSLSGKITAQAIGNAGYNNTDPNAVPQGANPNYLLGNNAGGLVTFSNASLLPFVNDPNPLSIVYFIDPSDAAAKLDNPNAVTNFDGFTPITLSQFTNDPDYATVTGLNVNLSGAQAISGATPYYIAPTGGFLYGMLVFTSPNINTRINTLAANGRNFNLNEFSADQDVSATNLTNNYFDPTLPNGKGGAVIVDLAAPEPGSFALLTGAGALLGLRRPRRPEDLAAAGKGGDKRNPGEKEVG